MSIIDVSAAFNSVAPNGCSCRDVTMNYLNGGKQQRFTFNIIGREPVEVVWDGALRIEELINIAVAQL